ncbi:MAG: hypothetical protein QM820_13370 [Minicystis sp.]
MQYRVLAFLLGLLALGCGGSAGNGPTGTGGAGGYASSSSGSTSATTSTGAGGAGGTASSSSSSSASVGSTSSSAASSSSSSGDYDAGVFPPHGDCYADADCPSGRCVPVTPGGFLVCATPPVKTSTCGSDLDQCCADKPCPNGEPCYDGPLVPICAGVPIQPHNQCAVDQCSQDVDCADGQICAPAGVLGLKIRACVTADCKVDADCNLVPGGMCAPVQEPCCGTSAGLFCVYPNGGCRSNADCPSAQFCQTSGSQATCQTGSPICPQ